MRHLHSCSLTSEEIEAQNARYEEGHSYDYILIGAGMSALSAGALLANKGYRVCLLEAHSVPGGYAHTFEMNGFKFCAEVHYIWGCAPGQAIHEFLKKLGLDEEVQFKSFDPEGYDRASLPDGNIVNIPYGFDKLVDNIENAYGGEREKLERFVSVIQNIQKEVRKVPQDIHWWHYITVAPTCLTLLKYRNSTLQDLFDKCGLSKQAQLILAANNGDLGLPPNQVSLIAYACLLSGYNEGAYYPEGHFHKYLGRIAEFIEEHPGCHIYYETEVSDIQMGDKGVEKVKTKDGKVFTADTYICNMDPKKASQMIGRDKFPKEFLNTLSYEYSASAFSNYVGFKEGVDLRDFGFTNGNIWHMTSWDMNGMWKQMLEGDYSDFWMFISSPTLRTNDPSAAPPNCHSLEFATVASYELFERLKKEGNHAYQKMKRKIRDRMIEVLEERFIPDLQKHVRVVISGTPTTNEFYVNAPMGNCYGSCLTPENVTFDRLNEKTPWDNFFWCNASSGYPGIHGTTLTGIQLYTKLTGDLVFDPGKIPSTEEAIAYAKRCNGLN